LWNNFYFKWNVLSTFSFYSTMAHSNSGNSLGNRSAKKKTTVAGLIIAVLIGGYTIFRPSINQATGWNLPAISDNQERPKEERVLADELEKASSPATSTANKNASATKKTTATSANQSSEVVTSAPDLTKAAAKTNQPAAGGDRSLKFGLLQ
jgi:hypothetical protein